MIDNNDTMLTMALIPTSVTSPEIKLPFAEFVNVTKIVCRAKHPQRSCWKSVAIQEVDGVALQLDRVAELIKIYGKTSERVELARSLFGRIPKGYLSSNVHFSYHWQGKEATFLQSLAD